MDVKLEEAMVLLDCTSSSSTITSTSRFWNSQVNVLVSKAILLPCMISWTEKAMRVFFCFSFWMVLESLKDLRRVVLGRAYRGLNGGILLLRNFSVTISVSPHVCFILVVILISMFLR